MLLDDFGTLANLSEFDHFNRYWIFAWIFEGDIGILVRLGKSISGIFEILTSDGASWKINVGDL